MLQVGPTLEDPIQARLYCDGESHTKPPFFFVNRPPEMPIEEFGPYMISKFEAAGWSTGILSAGMGKHFCPDCEPPPAPAMPTPKAQA